MEMELGEEYGDNAQHFLLRQNLHTSGASQCTIRIPYVAGIRSSHMESSGRGGRGGSSSGSGSGSASSG
jgi:hypothetical protein